MVTSGPKAINILVLQVHSHCYCWLCGSWGRLLTTVATPHGHQTDRAVWWGPTKRRVCKKLSSYNGPSEASPWGRQRISINKAEERNVCLLLGPTPTGSGPRMQPPSIKFLKLCLGWGWARVRVGRGCREWVGRHEICNPALQCELHAG